MGTSISGNQRASILYVEDNAENRLLIRRILNSEGHDVIEADSATAALRVLQNQTPDVILMDINMPDIDGYTLTTIFKSIPAISRTPIIAMTANVMKGDRERSFASGCDGYIQKPIDVDALPRQIARFLSMRDFENRS